jgi:hypothetical protein
MARTTFKNLDGATTHFYSTGNLYHALLTLNTGNVLDLNTKFRATGGLIAGSGALNVSDSDGFLYFPSCAGIPVGTPNQYGATVPFVYDSTNKALYAYSDSWRIISGDGADESVSLPTNLITGAGTAGTIPIWVSPSGLSNSYLSNNNSGQLQVESSGVWMSGNGQRLTIGNDRTNNNALQIAPVFTELGNFNGTLSSRALRGINLDTYINNGSQTTDFRSLEIKQTYVNCTGTISYGIVLRPPAISGGISTPGLTYGLYIMDYTGYNRSTVAPIHSDSTGTTSVIKGILHLGVGTAGIFDRNILRVNGRNATQSAIGGNGTVLSVFSTDSVSGDFGGGISFGGSYRVGNNSPSFFGAIEGKKENNITGNAGGYLVFSVSRAVSSMSEAMRITSGGNVIIGNSGIIASEVYPPLNKNAEHGFLYIPGTTGTPTSTPLKYGSTVPLVYDNFGKVLYAYSSGWQVISGAGGNTSFDNPTASVGLTAVNGVSTSAMRSDAAPALDQSIAPTWTSQHTFNRTALFAYSVLSSTGINFLTGMYTKNVTTSETYGFTNTPAAGTAGVITVKIYNSGSTGVIPAFHGVRFITGLNAISTGKYGVYTFAAWGDNTILGVEQSSF